jgi:hypothetical protein
VQGLRAAQYDLVELGTVMKKIVLLLLLTLSTQVSALELAGMPVAENLQLDKYALQLNGAGIRTKFLIKIYIAALYLGEKMHTGEEVLTNTGAKRMSFILLHEVSGKQVVDGINEAILPNNSEEEMKALESRLYEFEKMFTAVPEIKKGEIVNLDYIPGLGTRVTLNGVERGHIEGLDFSRALLKIWVGTKPVKAELKQHVLGNE